MSVRPSKTQISLGICPVWSESSLCAQWVDKDPVFFLRTAKTLIRLGWCPSWSESSLGAQSLCWFCHEAAQIMKFQLKTARYLKWLGTLAKKKKKCRKPKQATWQSVQIQSRFCCKFHVCFSWWFVLSQDQTFELGSAFFFVSEENANSEGVTSVSGDKMHDF